MTTESDPQFTLDTTRFKYCARYCEENVWHLSREPLFRDLDRKVVLISNRQKACAFWHQKAAPDPGMPICWDYHVVLLIRVQTWLVVDLDSQLKIPIRARTYLDKTFLKLGPTLLQFAPEFRMLDARDYIDGFNSDRSHMRDHRGKWLSPPPPWPPILGAGLPPLLQLVDFSQPSTFNRLTLAQMYRQVN